MDAIKLLLKLCLVAIIAIVILLGVSCAVSHGVASASFVDTRYSTITVRNTRTDAVLLVLTGKFSVSGYNGVITIRSYESDGTELVHVIYANDDIAILNVEG